MLGDYNYGLNGLLTLMSFLHEGTAPTAYNGKAVRTGSLRYVVLGSDARPDPAPHTPVNEWYEEHETTAQSAHAAITTYAGVCSVHTIHDTWAAVGEQAGATVAKTAEQ